MTDDNPTNQPPASAIWDQVADDIGPGLQFASDTDGNPVNCNGTTRRFISSERPLSWSQLFMLSDDAEWRTSLSDACRGARPVSGTFRLRRFDNAERIFFLRSEPRFDPAGRFVGHVTSGLDITEIMNQGVPVDSTSKSDRVQQLVGDWNDQFVSSVTVVTTSSEIIADLVKADADPMLLGAVSRLQEATNELRSQITSLRSMPRLADDGLTAAR